MAIGQKSNNMCCISFALADVSKTWIRRSVFLKSIYTIREYTKQMDYSQRSFAYRGIDLDSRFKNTTTCISGRDNRVDDMERT